VRYQGEVLSRMTIAESVWDMNFDYDSNVIDVNVRRLRAKVALRRRGCSLANLCLDHLSDSYLIVLLLNVFA
jgi:DNA-binding response OmpR family regulator